METWGKENKYSSVSWGRCRDDRKKEEKRGKINVIKLIENSFGINSSELGAIGNRVLGRSVLVFFNFFFCAVGKFCVFIYGTTEAEAKAAFTFRASRPLRPLAVDQRVVFRGVVSVKSSQREQREPVEGRAFGWASKTV